jgi:hypothetical protein
MLKVPEKSLIQLEQKLNEITFNQVPIGGTIVSALLIELLNGNRNWSAKEKLFDLIASYNLKYRGALHLNGSKKNIQYSKKFKNKGLITFISSRPHLFKINHTIWQSSPSDELLCLVKDRSALKGFSDTNQPISLSIEDLPSIDLKEWRKSFNKISQPLSKVIRSFLLEYNLPSFVGRRIINILITQTQYLTAFDFLLKSLQPKFVLVEHDRYNWCSSLILAANKLNIPTFTMMHGVVNCQFGYIPVLANYLFSWGHRQKELLKQYNGNADRIIVTGATQLDASIKASKKSVREKLNIPDSKKVVLLATNPVNPNLRQQLIKVFCTSINQNKNLVGIVRLHPSEKIEFYQEYIDKFPEIIFDKNEKVSYEESFAVPDIVCIYNSAYAMDAILKGLPVMIINIDKAQLGQAADCIEFGQFPFATSSSELSTIIDNYLNNREYTSEVDTKMKMYGRQYFIATEKAAAANIIKFIDSKVNLSGDKFNPKLIENALE